jgi:hypothetical protein
VKQTKNLQRYIPVLMNTNTCNWWTACAGSRLQHRAGEVCKTDKNKTLFQPCIHVQSGLKKKSPKIVGKAGRWPTRQNAGVNNLVAQRAAHGYRQGFYSVRVSEPWNSLPHMVKEAKSATVFKKRYRQHVELRVVRGDEPACQ